MRGFRQICLGIVIALWAGALPAAAQTDARVKQAAQHFADLEDDQAKTILEALSAEGVADADVLLGYLYSDPLFEGRDYEAAVDAFERAAANGNEEALFQLAESRFWPDYSDWTLTPDEKVLRPTAENVFGLLQRIVEGGSRGVLHEGAARWRLAWLCSLGGYDCGEEVSGSALKNGKRIMLDNLRAITGAFHILEMLRSGEADSSASRKVFDPYLSLSYADADPFAADVVTELVWRDVSTASDCPPLDGFTARGRLLAVRNGVSRSYENRLDLGDCYDPEQLATLEEDLVASLDLLARGFGNSKRAWHLLRCYQEQEAPSFGECLINAVRHHFFSCTKLSMPKYFNKRYEIEYRTSKRYEQCREMMLGYPPLHNRT